MNVENGEFLLSTDKARLDLALIHSVLRETHWAKGIPLATVAKAIDHSLCFGVYRQHVQVGFSRVISDHATFAYLADVFIVDAYRGRGLSKWMMSCVMAHPELQGLRRWLLATADAHGLYSQYGFKALGKPERFMEINVPDIYLSAGNQAA